MEQVQQHLLKRIKHARNRVNAIREYQERTPFSIHKSPEDVSEPSHNYFGGWDLGYWEGKVAAYEDLMDNLNG